jgi:hypothetical protein
MNSDAQQYIIRYDLAGETIRYFKIKKGDTSSTHVINLTKTNRVSLQLVNAANSYSRQIKFIERVENPETIIIPGFGNELTNNFVGVIPGMDKGMKSADIFKKFSDNKNVNKNFEIMEETGQQNAAKLAFTNRYNDFAAVYTKWEKAVLFDKDCQILWKDLATLRYSMQYTADEAKQTTRNKTRAVFPGSNDNPSLITLNTSAANPQLTANAVKARYTEMTNTYNSLNQLEIRSSVADSLVETAAKKMDLFNNISAEAGVKKMDAVVNRIADLYRQIVNDSYTQLTPLDINNKTVMAEIRFTPVIDSVTATALNINTKDSVIRYIPIYKKQSMRFRNSFGFSFVSFPENRWNYYISPDSIINRETASQFQPVIVTFLHFYSPRDKGFRWGGSLGAGLPLGGDNTKLNIMLGLSTFLGKNDPVSITAGISGTQVKKISGLKLGDKTNLSELTDKNFTSVYRIGYFIAVTFNPGSLNTKD